MDLTREYLETRSSGQLRQLLKARKLSTHGTKEQLIEDILEFEGKNNQKSSIKETRKSKKERKSTPRSQEEPVFSLNKLPLDIQGVTALNLSYEDILSLCQTNKKLSNICRNPDFWK